MMRSALLGFMVGGIVMIQSARPVNGQVEEPQKPAWNEHMTRSQFAVLADADGLASRLAGRFESLDKSTCLELKEFQGLLSATLLKGPNEGFIAFAERSLDPRVETLSEKADAAIAALATNDRMALDEIAGDEWFWMVGTRIGSQYMETRFREALAGRDLLRHRLITVRRKPEWADHGYSSSGWVYESLSELQFGNGEHVVFRIGWDPEAMAPRGMGRDDADLYATRRLVFLPQRAASWVALDALNDLVVRLSFVDESSGLHRKTIREKPPNRLRLGDRVFLRAGATPALPAQKPPTSSTFEFDNPIELRGWSRSEGDELDRLDVGRTQKGSLYLHAKEGALRALVARDVLGDVSITCRVSVRLGGSFALTTVNADGETQGVVLDGRDVLVKDPAEGGSFEGVAYDPGSWVELRLSRDGDLLTLAIKTESGWHEQIVDTALNSDWKFQFEVSGEGSLVDRCVIVPTGSS